MVMLSRLLAMVTLGGHGNQLAVEAEDQAAKTPYQTLAFGGRDGRGANLDAPADPGQAYPARPEWYFLFLFQLLKYFEGDYKLVGTVAIPNGAGVLLFLFPLL